MAHYVPSKPTRYESGAQERRNEQKAEEKQVERLLATLSKKLGPSDGLRKPSTRAAA
jgi:hypothetical protein